MRYIIPPALPAGVHSFAVYQPHRELVIRAESLVRCKPREIPPVGETPSWNLVRNTLRSDRAPEITSAVEYRFDSP
jgi:hypothetical protein